MSPFRSRLCAFTLKLAALPLLFILASPAATMADEANRLVRAINDYRSQPARCEGRSVRARAPLEAKRRLVVPTSAARDWRTALKRSGYRAAKAQAIRLTGPREARAALAQLKDRHCSALLADEFADIGVSQSGRDWLVVLARPQLQGSGGAGRNDVREVLAQVNAARSRPRRCGSRSFAAAAPLRWNNDLGEAAEAHSSAMARGNFFAHRDSQGRSLKDRARAAGYGGRKLGENIAAGHGAPDSAVRGWLASPGHCANLMNPMFTEMGAAYATNPRSDAGIYWTLLMGGQ
ncbi:Cysteine-rich secretory protein family protein [compost metagenome]